MPQARIDAVTCIAVRRIGRLEVDEEGLDVLGYNVTCQVLCCFDGSDISLNSGITEGHTT